MNYLTVKEAAIKWGMSERRVRCLLEDNRIEGASKLGGRWMISDNVDKPVDLRRKEKTRFVKPKSLVDFQTYEKEYPDYEGYYGRYGGSFISIELKKAFNEVYDGYLTICKSRKFIAELRRIREEYQGRPTPVYHCERLSNYLGKVQIYLKREDLNHTGAHKINHCMGEGLLAKYLGKKKLIAETGAGSHGVAVATAAAFYGLECEIHMGIVDVKKQAPNVARMKILGAKVVVTEKGSGTLKEAVDSAFESYSKNYKDSIYCIGSAVGPHPFPLMIRDFQKIVGVEAREQFLAMTGTLPDYVVACVGGGSNSIGMFVPFLNDPCKIVGVEPLGKGKNPGDNAASITYGEEGILHGFKSKVLMNENHEVSDAYSIASGLDYPSVGPEHAFLYDIGRVEYDSISDEEAKEAFYLLSRLEGIIPALESAHAVAYAIKVARTKHSGSILVNLSGRGDKDIDYMIEKYGVDGKGQ